MAHGKRATAVASVPGLDPDEYRVSQMTVPVADGSIVPVTILARTDADPSRRRVLLTGYGCYGAPMALSFDPVRLCYLDAGVTIAIAHCRGGGEFGRPWHEQARRLTKKVTIGDFIDVAEHLHTIWPHARIAIRGKSAGGTVVAAAANSRPDLFVAVSALVPFADPLHAQLDEQMPFTLQERAEWGDPISDDEEWEYLRSYCPYTRISSQNYPPTLVTASVHDRSVPYWQGARYAARLRARTTSGAPILLRTSFVGGHAGPSDIDQRAQNFGFEAAFILHYLKYEDSVR
jgi:oligopeptidase B